MVTHLYSLVVTQDDWKIDDSFIIFGIELLFVYSVEAQTDDEPNFIQIAFLRQWKNEGGTVSTL